MTGYNRNGLQTVHYWDEDHRMLASGNSLHNGFYFYNGEGERTYKLSGMTRVMNINGQPQTYEILDRATLYVSPYLVASERGASKHIYAGTERIASHPVNSAINGINSDGMSEEEFMAKQNAHIDIMLEVYLNYLPGESSYMNMSWDMLAHLRSTGQNMPKDEIYYYHTDHLGSTSWITYTDGSPVQYMSYMPFGELQIDQRSGDWNSRYTFYPEFIEGFSGKERDEETGYSYFGARYYDAHLSIWLSRDPLAHLYPHQSPYVYCSNNPIKRIDPNGMADEVIITGDQAEEAFDQLKNSTNLNLTMDTDGKINAHIDLNSNLSANDIELYTAIKSSDITVNIDASSVNTSAGSFMGSTYSENGPNGESHASTTNNVNITEMSSLEIQNNATKGSGMLHEITEGFQAGIITHDLKRGLQSAWITTSETKSVGVDGQKINLYRESPDYGFYLKSHRRASPAPNEFHRSRNR